jgi:sortase (surface protein transpeptidase)
VTVPDVTRDREGGHRRIDWFFEFVLALASLGVGSLLVGGVLRFDSAPAAWADSPASTPVGSRVVSAALASGAGIQAAEFPPIKFEDGVEDRSTGQTVPLRLTEPGATPMTVRIPRIGVSAEVIDLGLRSDNTLDVPSDFSQTGWYERGAAPGDPGPSVIVGHIDSKTGPAVFHGLQRLVEGDLVYVERSDGFTARYRVTGASRVSKESFPTEQVYGPSVDPVLRLITCGGAFDRDAGSYNGNLIVFAEHLGNVLTEPASEALG